MSTNVVKLNIGQPAQAVYQSIVFDGSIPTNFHGPLGDGSAGSVGFVIQTAFDPARMYSVKPAQGQTLAIGSSAEAGVLYTLLGNSYGGTPAFNFDLPDLRGAAPIYSTPPRESSVNDLPVFGASRGVPGNRLQLLPDNLPDSLGGESRPFENAQHALGMYYLINVSGDLPVKAGPAFNTLGTVYAFTSGLFQGAPDGFLPADGRLLKIADFQALYQLLGTTYGGDGQTTFALPDLRNRMPIGVGDPIDGPSIAIGETVGTSSLRILDENLPIVGDEPLPLMAPSLGLHHVISTSGEYLSIDPSGDPLLGQIVMYAGTELPDGWTPAHGQLLAIQDHQPLYSLTGLAFGGDGTTSVRMPDLRGRVAIGVDEANGLLLGDTRGGFEETIELVNLPLRPVPVPGVQITDASGQSIAGKVTGQFELDISGVWAKATVEYSSDGSTWSKTYEAQEGNNTLYVRQRDVFGRASTASQKVSFVLDTTAPEVPQVTVDQIGGAAPMMLVTTVLPDPDSQPAGQTVSQTTQQTTSQTLKSPTGKLSFDQVEAGAQLEFSVDGGQSWSDAFQAVSGLNAVQVRQVDEAGNVSQASARVEFEWTGSDEQAAITLSSTGPNGENLITIVQHGALDADLGSDEVDVLVHGHQRDLVLPRNIEQVRLTENGLNNTVTGHDGDNVFDVVVGHWVIEGLGGQDTVRLAHALSDYDISQGTDGQQSSGSVVTVDGPEGRVVLNDVEVIEFSDATLVKTSGQQIEQVDHLYEELLGRHPDMEGLSFWVAQMQLGASLQDVASGFADSAEFDLLYGTLSTEQLVEELYEAILDRAPDSEGLSFWVDAVDARGVSEGELIAELLLSSESLAGSTEQLSTSGLFVMA